MDKDRETSFEPAPNCGHSNKCKQFGMCWGAAMIKSQLNVNASDCDHPQAETARQEVIDLLDLNKPLNR